MPQSRFHPADGQALAADLAARGIKNPDVLRAMRTVPRRAFVAPENVDEESVASINLV